ncbi:MAG TPA: carbon storage regulator [Planctomycetia bacterium]|nr:carbon storage regulator [Planctomycetia bacterium]
MLVLSRRIGESIVIGDGVRVTIVSVRGNKVRVGIDAPVDVDIQRQELTAIPESRPEPSRRRLLEAVG